MQVFVINLPGIDDRKRWVKKHLKKRKIAFEFIDGIDGRMWTDEHVKSIVSDKLFEIYLTNRDWMKPGTIAGVKTVIDKFYTKIVEDKIDYALFLEDDIMLSRNFKSELDTIYRNLKQSKTQGVFLLHHVLRSPTKINKLEKLSLGNRVKAYKLNPGQKVSSGCGFIVSNKAAKQILENQKPISVLGDWWASHQNLDIYLLYPFLLHTGLFKSTLEYVRNPISKTIGSLPFFKQVIRHLRIRRSKKNSSRNIIAS